MKTRLLFGQMKALTVLILIGVLSLSTRAAAAPYVAAGATWTYLWNQGANGIAGSRVSRLGEISAPQDLVPNAETWVHGLAAVGSDCFLTSTARRSIGTDTYVLDVFGTWIGPEGRARNTLLVA